MRKLFTHFFSPFRVGLFLSLAFLVSPGAYASNRGGQVTQVIFFSLQRPGNIDDQNILLRAARSLRRTRGVVDFRAGPALAVDRAADFTVVITFKDKNAFARFVGDQRRQQNLDAILRPLVRRYTVYNFLNE